MLIAPLHHLLCTIQCIPCANMKKNEHHKKNSIKPIQYEIQAESVNRKRRGKFLTNKLVLANNVALLQLLSVEVQEIRRARGGKYLTRGHEDAGAPRKIQLQDYSIYCYSYLYFYYHHCPKPRCQGRWEGSGSSEGNGLSRVVIPENRTIPSEKICLIWTRYWAVYAGICVGLC